MLAWQFASPEEFIPICALFKSSKLGNDFIDIRRRVTIPLFLRQVITFYEDSKLRGFVTFAFLSEDAERHMTTTGIHPADWRSGGNFWVVDFAAQKGCSGYKMLRIITKALGIKKATYFHKKSRSVKQVRPI